MADTPTWCPFPSSGTVLQPYWPYLVAVLTAGAHNLQGGGGGSDRPATGQLWPRRA